MFRTPQVVLFSEDPGRAAAFYSSLGFTETFRVPTEDEPNHVDLTLDGYKIGIASVASTRDDHGLDPMASTRFLKASERPSSSGPTTLPRPSPNSRRAERPAWWPPHEWLGRLLIAWISDPDGNPIQIVQHL